MDVCRLELEFTSRSALQSSSSLRCPVEKHLNPTLQKPKDAAPEKSTAPVRAVWGVGQPPDFHDSDM
jgi:hypothetical protein